MPETTEQIHSGGIRDDLLAVSLVWSSCVLAGKKITAGHRPKTDQKAGMAVYLLNLPDIQPIMTREDRLALHCHCMQLDCGWGCAADLDGGWGWVVNF